MERKLLTRVGQAVYRLRSCTIEPVFGQMSMRGLHRFWLRSLQQVKAEWSLWCSTHNLLKLWRADNRDPRTALAVGVRSAPTFLRPVSRWATTCIHHVNHTSAVT